jgi:hypothetical protein
MNMFMQGLEQRTTRTIPVGMKATHTYKKVQSTPPVNQHRCGKPTVCRSFSPGNHGLSPIFLYGFPRAIGGFEGILELKTPRVLPSTGDECPVPWSDGEEKHDELRALR